MTLHNGHICFGRFLLDPQRRVVLADGKALPIQQRAFDLLEFLVRHRDRPVSRDEILSQVFRDVRVLPSNVSVQVHALRTAFRNAGCSENLILTLNQQRYQFIGALSEIVADAEAVAAAASEVAEVRSVAGPLIAPRRHLLAPALVFLLVLMAVLGWQGRAWFTGRQGTSGPSIVVLPFTNKSSDARQDWLVDAVTDGLMEELRRDLRCQVIERGTAAIYKKRNLTARETGRALNVRYQVDGTVEPAGEELIITAWLTDTESDVVLGDIHFSIPSDQLGNASDVIVGRIASRLNVTLVQSESDRAPAGRSGDPDEFAYHNYYRARSILDRHALREDYEAAQSLLEAAINAKPDFVPGLSELGWILAMKVTEVDTHNDAADEAEAKRVTKQALSLAPADPRALATQSRLLSLDGNYAEAMETAKKVLAIEPNRPDGERVLAISEYYSGLLEEAIEPLRSMIRIDPEGPDSQWAYQRLGIIMLLERNPSDAIKYLERSLAGVTPPEPGTGKFGMPEKSAEMLIAANEMLGNHVEAQARYIDYAQRWRFRTAWRLGTLSPRTLTSRKEFGLFLDMLVAAGMPRFADEHDDVHLAPTDRPLEGDVFAPTPLTIPRGNTLTTQQMMKLVQGDAPKLIIDVGHGSHVIKGATWVDVASRSGTNDGFVESLAEDFQTKHPDSPIVVMGDGTYDIEPYNAALNLIASGYRSVGWYRGGEEAWAKNKLEGDYRRKD